MKSLYVPEIGDEITLAKDWTFNLHCEYRNHTLGDFLGYNSYHCGWIAKSDNEAIDYLTGFQNRQENELYDEYVNRHHQWRLGCEKFGQDMIEATIPKGCILKIDRIYIRKGSKDYSSITFYVKNMGEIFTKSSRWSDKKVNKKAFRFWAKLSECNNIKFD